MTPIIQLKALLLVLLMGVLILSLAACGGGGGGVAGNDESAGDESTRSGLKIEELANARPFETGSFEPSSGNRAPGAALLRSEQSEHFGNP